MTIKNETYKFFADYIYKHSGISYQEKDYFRLDSRLNQLAKHFGVTDPDEFHTKFKNNLTNEMHIVLISLSTNNETSFFRDKGVFQVLRDKLIPEILQTRTSTDLLISMWSAGCSSGQEPYTISMTLDGLIKAGKIKLDLQATDISADILKKAKKGEYNTLEVQRGLPTKLLIDNFNQINESLWVVADNIKNRVNFGEFNLLTGTYPIGKYDIIFCRNVLIYQEIQNKAKIMNSLYNSLKKGGYLIMGSGESLIGISVPFNQVIIDNVLVFKKV